MKTKDIRDTLCKALKRAEKGELPLEEAKTIVSLANQISQSLATEVKVIKLKLHMGSQAEAIGQLNVTE